MPKFGDTREDGWRYKGPRKTAGGYAEQWISPGAWDRMKDRTRAYRLAWWKGVQADPARMRAYSATISGYAVSDRRKRPEVAMWRSAKARARKLGLEFTITPSDLTIPPVCPVLGIPLVVGGGGIDAAPALDRIDNNGGYVLGNIVVVSHRANRLKGDATAQELRRLARFYSLLSGLKEAAEDLVHGDVVLTNEGAGEPRVVATASHMV